MPDSRRVVFAGLASNAAITIAKLIVAAGSGSTAMLAEGLHSAVDTGNTGLLLLGLKRSSRPPHPAHPFGHGLELYFWSFVVAVSMCAVGGVLSIWEGLSSVMHPRPLHEGVWTYIVLAFSAISSAVSFVIALREVHRRRGEHGVIEYIRASKDPTVFSVVLEDASDIAGNFVAAAAIFLATRLHVPAIDGLGSMLVGLIILAVSIVLANECRGLLLGEAAPAKDVEGMKQLLASDDGVERVGNLLTMQLGPNAVLLNVDIDFAQHRSIEDLEQTIDRLERRVRQKYPKVQHLFIEAESIRHRGNDQRKAS